MQYRRKSDVPNPFRITGVSMRELVKNLWPFITLMYAVLFLCMLFPPLVTWLPHRLGY